MRPIFSPVKNMGMKKKLFLPVVFSLLAGLVNGVAAQDDTLMPLPPVYIYSKTNVTKAVNTAFEKRFKDAVNPEWYRVNKDYLVTFITADMRNNAYFKKSGRMVYHIRYGKENNLPQEIRKMIHDAYGDYNITNAVQVQENNRNIWVVNLEGLKKLKVVRVEDGELEEVKSLDKTM